MKTLMRLIRLKKWPPSPLTLITRGEQWPFEPFSYKEK